MNKKYYRMELKNQTAHKLSEGISVIQYCKSSHHSLIRILYGESFGEAPWDENWDEIHEFDPNGVFVAIDTTADKPAGFVVSFRRGFKGYISVVAVLPKFRRRGIASALIIQAAEYLRSLGLECIIIDVDADNPGAETAYKKIGFEVVKIYYNE